MNDKTSKVLRIIVIIFMGLTAAMNLLGGAGTVCAAFYTKEYPSMLKLLDYQWLYQSLVVVTVVIGLLCVWSTIALTRGKKHAYRNAVILLLVGTVVSGVHVYASLSLRGRAVPANIKLYVNVAALLLFLLSKWTGMNEQFGFSEPGDDAGRAMTSGLAAVVAGTVVLTTEFWVGSSHVFQGEHWVRVLQAPLVAGGAGLMLGGLSWIRRPQATAERGAS